MLSQFTKKQIGNNIAVNNTKNIEMQSTPTEKLKPFRKKKVSLN
jgi:hypothetical protein